MRGRGIDTPRLQKFSIPSFSALSGHFDRLDIPIISFFSFLRQMSISRKKSFASTGNRTRAARVAGEHSTTEPSMLYTQGCLPDAALLAFLAGQGSQGAPNMRLSNFSMKTSRHFSECHTALSKNRMLKKNINAVGRIRTYARRAELISSQSP